jgi:hypothetical protein
MAEKTKKQKKFLVSSRSQSITLVDAKSDFGGSQHIGTEPGSPPVKDQMVSPSCDFSRIFI